MVMLHFICSAMVTCHLRAPYGLYVSHNCIRSRIDEIPAVGVQTPLSAAK